MASPNVGPNLGNAGNPIESEIGGQKVRLRYIDQRVKAALEQALVTKARNLLKEDKAEMSDEEYAVAYGAYSDRIVAGHYAFSNRMCQNWLPTVEGLSHILHICGNIPLQKAESMILEYPLEVGTLIRLVMESSFPNLNRVETETTPKDSE